MKKYGLVILLALLTFSCNSDEETSNPEMTNVEHTLIAKENLFGNGGEGIAAQNRVINNQNSWNDLIAQMNTVNNVSGSFTEIDIDFSQYSVIAVFDEIRTSGGYSLELNIMSNSENIIVNITDVEPGGNVFTVMTQPFIIVKILNSDLPVIFE